MTNTIPQELHDTLHTMLFVDEGCRHFPYVDTVGCVTIGIGHNLTQRGITEDVLNLIFDNDLDIAYSDARNVVGSTFDNLTEPRKAVLINMAFNLGAARLSTFVNMLTHLRRGEYSEAADAMFASQWAKQVGTRAQRLANLMRNG